MSAQSPAQEITKPAENAAENALDAATIPLAERQLGEIRDLLFGEQMRALQNNVALLRREMQDRMDSLSSSMTQNLKQLRKDFGTRVDELGRHVDQLNRNQENRLVANHDELNARIATLRQDVERSDQTLEQQLVDMSTTLHTLISSRVQEIMEQLSQTQLELRYSKADRKILASLLDKMANELNQDG